MPKLNFTGVKDAKETSDLIPEGIYNCMVDACDLRFTKTTGAEFFNLHLKVMEGDQSGRYIFDSLFFSEKALPRAKSALAALGIDVTGEVDLTPEMLIGKFCQVSVKHRKREYNGETKVDANVEFDGYRPWNPPAGVIPPKTEEPEVMDFSDVESMEDAPF